MTDGNASPDRAGGEHADREPASTCESHPGGHRRTGLPTARVP